jgi:hypothetical protein
MTITRTTANIMAYSATSCPSSFHQTLYKLADDSLLLAEQDTAKCFTRTDYRRAQERLRTGQRECGRAAYRCGSRVWRDNVNQSDLVCGGYWLTSRSYVSAFLARPPRQNCGASHKSQRCHLKRMRRSCGIGVQDGYCSRLRHMERTGDPMSRARSRLVVHIIYDGCAFASGQFCSVLGNILTGNILERIESLPCRVSATTVTESQQGSPVGRCQLLHEEESQRLRKRVGVQLFWLTRWQFL